VPDRRLIDAAWHRPVRVRVDGGALGNVIDESRLLGIMAQCRVLGLTVVSAHRIQGSRS
jgi:hypothetical protein